MSTASQTRSQRGVLEPQIIVALDCERPFEWPSRHLLGDVDRVFVTRSSIRDARRKLEGGVHSLTLALADRFASQHHAVLQRVGHHRWSVVDQGSRHGLRVNGVSIQRRVLHDGDLIEVGRTLLMFRSTVPPVRRDLGDLSGDAAVGPAGLATFVDKLAQAYAAVERVAASPVPVILKGERGTGKELVARALHMLSRRAGTLVQLSAGAVQRPGLLRAAHGGTLLLDDVGDLPGAEQHALDRALHEPVLVPVSDSGQLAPAARLVSTTARPLDLLVARGSFSADLLARLGGLTVSLPRLADRREDIGLLVAAMLRRKGVGPSLAPDAALALFRHDWPVNLRELERTIEIAALEAGAGRIELGHLPTTLPRAQTAPPLEAEADGEELGSLATSG